jgi:phosphatidate cytidylyltransferase
LIPSVSPKKTWEGFIGGAIGAAITMLVLIYFRNGGTTETYVLMAIVSLLVSVLATFGDLFESKLKRAAEVKDSGNILPGHGGILDRIDAMLFAVPVLYVFLTTIFI